MAPFLASPRAYPPSWQELLGQAGVSTRKVLAVPCTSPDASSANAAQQAVRASLGCSLALANPRLRVPTKFVSPLATLAQAAVPGVMILYTSLHMEQSDGLTILSRMIGSAIAATDALQPWNDAGQAEAAVAAASPLAPVPDYVSIPSHTAHTSTNSLLLAVAHALGADVAEQWCAALRAGPRVHLP